MFYRPRHGGRKSFSWRDDRGLLTVAHARLDGRIALLWDGLDVHEAAELREFATSRDRPAIPYLPPCAPDLMRCREQSPWGCQPRTVRVHGP
ncbi:hypothetical protein GCM10010405_51220 [Streptomyces macrosporus]|uniref:Transposase n=1 Tax=Streptomyces macrosporus TaxID=44032 RepID=A0ABN3KI55_9ACTN